MLKTIVFSTLGELATGILLFIALVPPDKIGKGFARFHVVLVFCLWVLSLWGRFNVPFFVMAFLLFVTYFTPSSIRFYYPSLISAFLASLYLLVSSNAAQTGFASALLLHLPPVLVLGASSVAMLLGHWYLVAPKLSIKYLKIVTIGLILSILIRSGLILGFFLANQTRLFEGRFFEIYGIFFIQRIALGILLTFVLSVLSYRCVRIRSTQSATGILYVVVVFCLIGELIGSYLFLKTGIFF